jgi:hypothetical protein
VLGSADKDGNPTASVGSTFTGQFIFPDPVYAAQWNAQNSGEKDATSTPGKAKGPDLTSLDSKPPPDVPDPAAGDPST